MDDVVDDLGTREAVARAREIAARGTGAERQLEVWKRTEDLKEVMDFVVRETELGLGIS